MMEGRRWVGCGGRDWVWKPHHDQRMVLPQRMAMVSRGQVSQGITGPSDVVSVAGPGSRRWSRRSGGDLG
ncbi:hypothetical protein NS14008_31505 [Nocardia seriolae]|nr:hypothetical protein NS14008_31505 [Nocardia seriolae]PSK29582.1 hypothetical protein C6575_20520 [Nocardia seriolae]RLP30566.1 hypothetical protein D6158_17655 [Nocardia seriolae]